MFELIQKPWPWYIAGPAIGLMVPLLLYLGNKSFGVSSSLRHICAACFPAKLPYFSYDWKKEIWNLFFVAGIIGGAAIAWFVLKHQPGRIDPRLLSELQQYGISDQQSLVPAELFSWEQLLTIRGLLMIVLGGFLIGFGTRYAGGCTSGHSIMGLSNLQLPSLIATVCFMAGGFLMANVILPFILQLH